MANSRLEKIGTIYTRVKTLMDSRALAWKDRPVWYDVYEAFPPREEPRFDRPAPADLKLRAIFYEEDKVRARLHKSNPKSVGAVNLLNTTSPSYTQKFVETYTTLEKQYGFEADEEKLFNETLDELQRVKTLRANAAVAERTLVDTFKSADTTNNADSTKMKPIDIKDIFK